MLKIRNKELNNASWIIGGRVAQMVLALVVGILTVRYLGPANYGLINYGMAYIVVLVENRNSASSTII